MMFNYIIDNLVNSISSSLVSHSKRVSLSQDLENYLITQQRKLKLTKSIIFRNEPIDFYDNYVPLTLTSKIRNIRVSEPYDLVLEFMKVGIIGAAGSGKTTLLRHIALKAFELGEYLPVIIELRNYNSSSMTFEDFVAYQVSETNYLDVKKLFKEPKFIFIFDGYDEIDYVKGNDFINQIDKFITNFSQNKFVISSRPGTNVESLSPFYIFDISPLNENDISLYIEKLNIPYETRKRLLDSLRNEQNFSSFLKNPLLLSLFIITYNNIGFDVPPNKSIFLRRVIDNLFSVHDSVSKLGYVRDKLSNLNVDSLEKIASILAFRIFFSSKYSLSKDELYQEFEVIKKSTNYSFENDKLLYDFTITIGILIDNGNYYSYPHISILEYLTASFISTVNEKAKSDLYGSLLIRKSHLVSVSFYEFLFELDKLSFNKYYLIPSLEVILEKWPINQYYEEPYSNSYTILNFIKRNVKPLYFNISEDEDEDFSKYEIQQLLKNIINETDRQINNDDNPIFDILR